MKKVLLALFIGLSLIGNTQEFAGVRQTVNPVLYPFFHGVASGDPLIDKVIIWTRISPREVDNSNEIAVEWRMATDTGMTNVIASGITYTSAERDYTVKVDVGNLSSNSHYYYDFKSLDNFSVRGRTKTAPRAGEANQVRLGLVSCSNYEYGYFNGYRQLANGNDIDAVVHLGDYIYEYEVGGYSAGVEGRKHVPENETISLEDYRLRYSHYRLDDDLKFIHQQYPFIVVWDDHESANNSFKDGAENHTEGEEGAWMDRKNFAASAYMEWMPIREDNGLSIYRTIDFGDMARLVMLDTRIEGRDEQVALGSLDVRATERSLLGTTQLEWMKTQLATSRAKWNILGQQVMFAPLKVAAIGINTDQWDGYEAERARVLDFVTENDINNFVVLTGDIHTSWANDIPTSILYEPILGTGSAGVEFVCTSITSPGLDELDPLADAIRTNNLHMQYIDLAQRGYMVLSLSNESVQGDWFYTAVDTKVEKSTFGAGYFSKDGTNHLRKADGPAESILVPAPFAPVNPVGGVTGLKENEILVFGIYPNPFDNEFVVQFYKPLKGSVELELINSQGQIIKKELTYEYSTGVNYLKVSCGDIAAGTYTLLLKEGGTVTATTVFKK